jgi:PleD family two-component response regulator/DNA-directed RNA polymerase subunit RPC12/RpoP
MKNGKIKILIVDDDNMVRETYMNVFRRSNFDVVSAVDGLDGLDLAAKELPDIIFTGIIMPRMDGFTMMESLKKNVATSGIPVVISSHMGREEDREKAKTFGVKDFIVRGMTTPNEAVERIKSLFVKNYYDLSVKDDVLDARRIANELNLGEYKCSKCGSDLVLRIRFAGVNKGDFTGNIVCPECEKR